MGRPLYQTEDQKVLEKEWRLRLEKLWEMTIYQLPNRYKVDWIVVDPEPVVVIEFKVRDISHDKYDTIMLSLDKVMAGQNLGVFLKVPFEFVVAFTDGLYRVNVLESDCKVEWSGRSQQKRDWQDVEPCVMIPSKEFEKIEIDA